MCSIIFDLSHYLTDDTFVIIKYEVGYKNDGSGGDHLGPRC